MNNIKILLNALGTIKKRIMDIDVTFQAEEVFARRAATDMFDCF